MNRTLSAVAASILLLIGALVVGFALPDPVSSEGRAGEPYLHVHPDGHVWRHDPATGEAVDLGISGSTPIAPLAGSPFTFGAAGDFGFYEGQSVMTTMGNSGLNFALVLGDFSYGHTTEQNWCNFFESKVGDGKVLLIAGNHDTGDSAGGNINTYRQYCNFGISASLTGDYGKEYYFDYPQASPLARFVLTGCGLSWPVDGQGYWSCVPGNAHYNFVSNAIDGARSANIPWVIVGMHKTCISNGQKSCEIGEAFQDLLLSKKVDLVLQAHDHNYQRSKQLSCADDNNFRPACVADTDDSHVHGAGEVVNIAGTGGAALYGTGGTPDELYFSKWASTTSGFLQITVSASALSVTFKNVIGSFVDSYEIKYVESPSPDFSLSASPTSVTFAAGASATSTITVGGTDGFAGRVDLTGASTPSGASATCVPSSILGSGTSTCTLRSLNAGSYRVTITGTSGTLVHIADIALTVTAGGPTARFTHAPEFPEVNELVSFDASPSTDTDPDATMRARWDWEGDGVWDTSFSSSMIAQHTFTTVGSFPVRLEILDSNGLSNIGSHGVLVFAPGSRDVGAQPGYGLTDPSKLEARGPIHVGSNAGFTAANGVRRGTGTLSDPYVISDWFIDGSLYPGIEAMIHIENTSAYVTIENNRIVNLADANHWEAVQIGRWATAVDTHHVTIRHNQIENARHAYGIMVREGSRDVRIEANYVRLDATNEWVTGIATDRGVHDVTIHGNYVDAYTSGSFHTTGIRVSDTHVDDARRATGVAATWNTVANATGGAIVSASSTGTMIGWNLMYMNYPGMKSVSAGFPRGIDTAWNSDGATVVGNVIHTFVSGILIGSDSGTISSNTIYNVDYGIFVPDNASMPGVSTYANVIYNTAMWNVANETVRLPASFQGTVVDLGLRIRPTDFRPVTLVTHGAATRISYVWSGSLLNLSTTVGGLLAFDTETTLGSQTLSAVWTGTVENLDVSGFSPSTVAFHLVSTAEVAFEGSGFSPATPYYLIRSNSGGTTTVLNLASTPTGGLAFTIPAADPSDYRLALENLPDTVAPVSTHNVSGTVGTNGWYTSDVNVALTAADDSSGIAAIHVRVDGGAWQVPAAAVLIRGDGVHTIDYYATDVSGNDEAVHSLTISIDTAAPVLEGLSPSGALMGPEVTVSWAGSDAVSGIASYAVSINGGIFEPIGIGTSLPRSWADGLHRVQVKAIDNAGHESVSETIFMIESDAADAGLPTGPTDLLNTYGTTLFLVVAALLALSGAVWYFPRRRELRPSARSKDSKHEPERKDPESSEDYEAESDL